MAVVGHLAVVPLWAQSSPQPEQESVKGASSALTVHRLVVRDKGVFHQREEHELVEGERFVVETVEGSGWLGVHLIDLTPELREYFGAPSQAGILISRVVAGGPASQAGARVGDLILSVDGAPAVSAMELGRLIRVHGPGQELSLQVLRAGKKKTFQAKLESLKGHSSPRSRVLVRAAPDGGAVNNGATVALESLKSVCLTQEWQDKMASLGKLDWKNIERRMQSLERKLETCESKVASATP